MLKKIGFVVAASAAGLLAVSPLAFATDTDGSSSSTSVSNETTQSNSVQSDNSQSGVTNTGDLVMDSQSQTCGNDTSNSPLAIADVISMITQDMVPTETLGALAPVMSSNDAAADATTSTTVTCTQSGDTGDQISQSNTTG